MKAVRLQVVVKKHLPVVNWLTAYSLRDFLCDLLAGLTVGLTLIPQAIAYASLAGLGAQYGLYSSFAGSFVYILFGTIKEVNIGPTAIISLMTFSYASGIPEQAILLCFLSGCITVTLGILRLSFLVNFVSTSVVGGFTSAASLIIACSQIKGLLGLSFQSENFFDIWSQLIQNISKTRIPDLILSCCCIIILLTLRVIKDIKLTNKVFSQVIWLVGTARNAIVVIVTTIISYFLTKAFIVTGQIDTGLPQIKPPAFSYVSTDNQTVTFYDMLTNIGSGLVVVPMLSVIGNIAIAKAFSQGKTLDATQELLALGFSNIVGSFFQSMPVSGSFSRSAVNNASGVRTPFGGFYTGIIVILSLSFLTPYFYYIPKATLSSVIICAVIFMVEISTLKSIWKCSKRDLIPSLGTFIACLWLGVELGILVGIAIDFIILSYFNARPIIIIEKKQNSTMDYFIVKLSSGLMYPAVDHVRNQITKHLLQSQSTRAESQTKYVIFDCQSIDKIDFTAVQNIHSIVVDLNKQNYQTIFMNAAPRVLKNIQSFSSVLTIKSEIELINESLFSNKKSVNEFSTSL